MKNIENQDIIITSLQSWDIEIGSNCKNIAVEFSKNNRVLYVNPPMDRLSVLRKKNNKKASAELREIKENLWVYYPETIIESISRLPVNFLFDIFNIRNNKTFANDIKKAIKKLNFSNYIHFCDSDMFRSYYLKELLNPKLYIYYTRDNLMAVKYWQTQGTRIEPLHMAKADMVVANSTYLSELATVHNKNSFFVGQGCDLTAFNAKNNFQTPEDMVSIQGPVIGYIGALKTLRLDIDILKNIALSKPDWSIVLVGPEDENFLSSSLHSMKNVWFLGSKDESELPAYLQAFDVAINPQVINEITIGNYPRKIDEYLAMGKPVVATKTKAMKYFKDHVSLANSHQEWIDCIEYELNNNSENVFNKREEFACQHTWEKNVTEIYKCIIRTKNHES